MINVQYLLQKQNFCGKIIVLNRNSTAKLSLEARSPQTLEQKIFCGIFAFGYQQEPNGMTADAIIVEDKEDASVQNVKIVEAEKKH